MAKAAAHPTMDQLRAFGLGRMRPAEAAIVERHVEQCDDCCRVLAELPDDAVIAKIKQYGAISDESETVTFTHRIGDKMSPVRGQFEPAPIEGDTSRGQVPAALLEHPRYRILKMLGRGGMGVVYKAEHRMMERPVALKVISRRLIANPLAVERFHREVRAAARLTHPNIVVAHDAEQAGDLHFLVMEFVDGISLAQYVERYGPLPPTTACLFIRQAALGLQHAAQLGMVHRDIKPQNLMLTRKRQIKILDFGLARLAQEEESQARAKSRFPDGQAADAGLTEAGMILGTPDYMAPEQATDSSKADTRSDIYSLGCTFYYLLSGKAPFASASITRTLKSHADRQAKPLPQLRDDLPTELVQIVERMMAKDPAERFQTLSELAKALTPLSIGGQSAAGAFESGAAKRSEATAAKGPVQTADEVPTTIQLMQRGHWRTIRNRAVYEFRQFFRSKQHRVLAVVGPLVALLLVLSIWNNGSAPIPSSEQAAAPTETNGLEREPLRRPPDRMPEVAGARRPVQQAVVPQKAEPTFALMLSRREFMPLDYQAMRREFETREIRFTIVSSERGAATPRGSPIGSDDDVPVDLSLFDIKPGQFDAIIIIPAGQSEFNQEPLFSRSREKITELYKAGTCIAGMGASVILLAEYDLLTDQPAVGQSWLRAMPRMQRHNIQWDTQARVVSAGSDGRLFTAHDFGGAAELVERILETIQRRKGR